MRSGLGLSMAARTRGQGITRGNGTGRLGLLGGRGFGCGAEGAAGRRVVLHRSQRLPGEPVPFQDQTRGFGFEVGGALRAGAEGDGFLLAGLAQAALAARGPLVQGFLV